MAISSQGHFTNLPQNYQLYSHNADNRAGVVFGGITAPDYTKLPVQTPREGVLSGTLARRQLKRTAEGTLQPTAQVAVDGLTAGLYVADLQTATGQTLRRKVVIR